MPRTKIAPHTKKILGFLVVLFVGVLAALFMDMITSVRHVWREIAYPNSPTSILSATSTHATISEVVSITNNAPSEPVEEQCMRGYSRSGGACLFFGCPAGFQLSRGLCIESAPRIPQKPPVPPKPLCASVAYCAGPDTNDDGEGDELWNRNSACVESKSKEVCSFGCSRGICTTPLGTGGIRATPPVVASGSTVVISWTTGNMVAGSCRVTELSALINDVGIGESGSFVSSPLKEKTPYVLACTELGGALFTDTVYVGLEGSI